MGQSAISNESRRLIETRDKEIDWHRWGPYLSERSWGTVREDYSPDGNAWDYLSHDQARAKAYRWGEDGLAGISDRYQLLCFGLALWNGKDPIIKERAFGLTSSQGNHGEDVKDYYFYLDSTPTHSYMKYLYKYPRLNFHISGWCKRISLARVPDANLNCSIRAFLMKTNTSIALSNTPNTMKRIWRFA